MANAATLAPLSLRDQITVFTVSLAHGATHWLHMVPTVLMLLVKKEFGLDYTDVGLFGTVYYAAGFVTNLVSGPLTDLMGRRERFQIVALLILCVSMVVMSLATGFWTFTLAAALITVGNSLWHPAAIPYLATRYDDRRGYVLSIHSVCSSFADFLAPTVIGGMISGWFFIQFTWRETALINVWPVVVALPFVFYLIVRDNGSATFREKDGMDVKSYIDGMIVQLKNKAVIGLAIMAGLRSTAQGSIRLFFPFYVAEILNVPPAQAAGMAGLALTAMNLGGTLAAVPAGMASDKYGRRPLTMWALGISTIAIVALTFLQDEISLVIGICIVGFSIYALRPVMLSWMMDIVPSELRGSGTNLMFTTQTLLQVASPLIAGLLADKYGLVSVFYLAAGILLLANAVAFMLPKDEVSARAAR
ncbi:MAG: MFS transporter [Rhodospirillales bacterium]